MIRLDEIAGYLSERNVWKLVRFLAETGRVCSLKTVRAEDLAVEDDGYGLGLPEERPDGDVWNIGALAFYAVMGVHVFEGKGVTGQVEDTVIPKIPSSHAGPELSSLIYSCLNHDPEARPGLEDVFKAAEAALSKKAVPVQGMTTNSGRKYKESLVKFWPEEMLGLVLLAVMLSFTSLPAYAQSFPAGITDQMKTLVRRCVDLRAPENADAVSREFMDDHSWTMLDEIAMDRDDECTIYDQVNELGVNNICCPILLKRQGVVNTGGNFVSGQDPRYNYSLIELTAKAGSCIDYLIEKRQGTQTFAIVPYEPDAAFSVELEEDGVSIANPVFEDGICYVKSIRKMSPEDKFRISIRNESGKNMAFTVINYNARD